MVFLITHRNHIDFSLHADPRLSQIISLSQMVSCKKLSIYFFKKNIAQYGNSSSDKKMTHFVITFSHVVVRAFEIQTIDAYDTCMNMKCHC